MIYTMLKKAALKKFDWFLDMNDKIKFHSFMNT